MSDRPAPPAWAGDGIRHLQLDASDDLSRFESSVPAAQSADSLAYVLFTSGSTGRPKGVAMPHQPLFRLMRWHAGIPGLAEPAAWAGAQEIGDRTEERVNGRQDPLARRNNSSVGAARLRDFAAQGDVLDERLWMRVARPTGTGGNSTALVGTAEQVADALLRYIELGVSTVLIRGFDPLGDAVAYGHELIPRLREATKDLDPHKELAAP
jgi:alkanesulfonate monooxygenase